MSNPRGSTNVASSLPFMKSLFYERLFLLNRCPEQAAEIVEQFQQERLIHPEYAGARKHALEDLRANLSHVLTGMLHQRELEACVALTQKQLESEDKYGHKHNAHPH